MSSDVRCNHRQSVWCLLLFRILCCTSWAVLKLCLCLWGTHELQFMGYNTNHSDCPVIDLSDVDPGIIIRASWKKKTSSSSSSSSSLLPAPPLYSFLSDPFHGPPLQTRCRFVATRRLGGFRSCRSSYIISITCNLCLYTVCEWGQSTRRTACYIMKSSLWSRSSSHVFIWLRVCVVCGHHQRLIWRTRSSPFHVVFPLLCVLCIFCQLHVSFFFLCFSWCTRVFWVQLHPPRMPKEQAAPQTGSGRHLAS